MKIVFDEIRITGGNQRQRLGTRVGHVGCGVEPILKEKEQAKDEAGGLALCEEIRRQKKRNQPLQKRASPKAKGWTEPAEQIMPSLMNDEVGIVNEEKPAAS